MSSKEEEKHNKIKIIIISILIILIIILLYYQCYQNNDIKNSFGYSNYAYMGRCNTDINLLNIGNKFSF